MAVRTGKGNAARKPVGLTKSRLLVHRQCPKRLWLETFQPELAAQDEGAVVRMATGTRAGEIARRDYPKGRLVEAKDRATALAETKTYLSQQPRPVFEGAFEAGGVHVRADILLPGKPGFQLVEVKSSLKVKDYHYEDAAIQSWVVAETGLRLKRIDIAYIDKTYVYPGGGNYRGLFKRVDVSKDARAFHNDIPRWIKAARRTMDGKEPNIEIGDQCEDPFTCPFIDHCKFEAGVKEEDYPVEILPRKDGKALAAKLRAKGYGDLRRVPERLLTKPLHQRIWRATKTGRPELDPAAAQDFLKFEYPHYYLDFETLNPVIPVWPGTSPMQTIPFQWSCHVEYKDGKLRHQEFLADGSRDPRPELATKLIKALGTKGPIFTYSHYESRVIGALIAHLPKLAGELMALQKRLVDLLKIAQKHYYHRDLHGSWSLKRVLPTIAPELDYSDLEVANGGMAQNAFIELIQSDTPAKQKKVLRRALLQYCGRDTLATTMVARYLQKNDG